MREFIVEADGGSRGNPGPAGYGAVVIDAATGETLAETAEYLGVVTNNVAEYRGLVAGLRAAHALDPAASVRVRMDSKLVVEQMSGRWKIKHPDMKPLAMEAGRVFPAERVTYEWIPRERNRRADRLANEAMDAGTRGEPWTPSPPAATPSLPEPGGPPGDATAGAAKARAALAGRSSAGGSSDAAVRSSAGGAGGAAGRSSVSGAVGSGSSVSGAGGAVGSGSSVSGAGGAVGSGSSVSGVDESVAARGASSAPVGSDANAARNVATPRVGWGAPDLGAPATFVLLRHGETPLTPEKRFSGSGGSDPSLSGIGREQAARVAEALARRGTIQAVVASPLARARETAGVVAARLGLEVGIDDGLRETDFGAWEGLTFAEVHERHPDDLSAWLASPDAEPTGGGESFAATATRIAATRDKLVAAYTGRTVLLVTHVTPIKTLVRLALGAPPESLFRMELSAASLSVVAYYADGNASVRLLNDTSHLR
ncbi:bifunctional RNase H/acid phosphatase [Streptomyces chromofuscus]|uniref:Bifunctional RNase H/acid phosphatase n=1 Tax=Streptomyces chromofuscus TaxID=42881 RepID=A0A7M2TEL4_STRCW|nr:bifunctional RNase H/acid phosphatase [Streptomyces chromofuscus]QOV46383.1 bifunctional RNase H/acid phosphatase [Streptomyces chromofuscus]